MTLPPFSASASGEAPFTSLEAPARSGRRLGEPLRCLADQDGGDFPAAGGMVQEEQGCDRHSVSPS